MQVYHRNGVDSGDLFDSAILEQFFLNVLDEAGVMEKIAPPAEGGVRPDSRSVNIIEITWLENDKNLLVIKFESDRGTWEASFKWAVHRLHLHTLNKVGEPPVLQSLESLVKATLPAPVPTSASAQVLALLRNK